MTGVKIDAKLTDTRKCRNCNAEIDRDVYFVRSRRYDEYGLMALWFCSPQCFYEYHKEEIEL